MTSTCGNATLTYPRPELLDMNFCTAPEDIAQSRTTHRLVQYMFKRWSRPCEGAVG